MTKPKRFSLNHMPLYGLSIVDNKDGGYCRPENEQDLENLCQILNELYDENEGLKHHISELQGENEILNKENAMLKNTIARNEAYIERIQHKGEWKK